MLSISMAINPECFLIAVSFLSVNDPKFFFLGHFAFPLIAPFYLYSSDKEPGLAIDRFNTS